MREKKRNGFERPASVWLSIVSLFGYGMSRSEKRNNPLISTPSPREVGCVGQRKIKKQLLVRYEMSPSQKVGAGLCSKNVFMFLYEMSRSAKKRTFHQPLFFRGGSSFIIILYCCQTGNERQNTNVNKTYINFQGYLLE